MKTFITKNEDGTLNINQSCRSAGVGPAKSPDRDGSADYYLCGGDVRIVFTECSLSVHREYKKKRRPNGLLSYYGIK